MMDWGDGIFASFETWEEEFRVQGLDLKSYLHLDYHITTLRLSDGSHHVFLLVFHLGSADAYQKS